MSNIIHKADYKRKVETYLGLGQYDVRPSTLCRGPKALYSKRKPRGFIARNWKHVTCKNCLKKKT